MLERKQPPCLPRRRSKRVLPGGLVLPRRGSICRGSTAGKTPQGWRNKRTRRAQCKVGTWKTRIQALLLPITPGGIALVRQTLEKIKTSQAKRPPSHPVHLKLVSVWEGLSLKRKPAVRTACASPHADDTGGQAGFSPPHTGIAPTSPAPHFAIPPCLPKPPGSRRTCRLQRASLLGQPPARGDEKRFFRSNAPFSPSSG